MVFGTKKKYYSLDNILKTDSRYYVIFGERSNGKTYACLEHCLLDYFKSKGKNKFCYLRRFDEDIRPKRAGSIFANHSHIIMKYTKKYDRLVLKNGMYYLAYYDNDLERVVTNEEYIGLTMSLNSQEHNKSSSYPDVVNIVFDEFISRDNYLIDEFMLFTNSLSTIIRDRDNVKIFMLGNTINKFCPYFSEMGLKNITKMQQGSIDIYKCGQLRIAVEYCSNMESKASNVYFSFDNPKLEMIKTGAWELAIYPHLDQKFKKSDIQFIFFILFDEKIYQCEIVTLESDIFIYIHQKTTEIKDTDSDLIYSLENSSKFNRAICPYKFKNKIEQKISNLFKSQKVFYQDNETGDAIQNYLRQSIQVTTLN